MLIVICLIEFIDDIHNYMYDGYYARRQTNLNEQLEGHWASGPRCIWVPEGKDMGTVSTLTILAPYDGPFSPEHAGVKVVALRRILTEF